MLDLDEQVGRVWDPDVRPLVAEAWRCYGVGAYRASITLTWVAVCADLTAKVIRLADDGDGIAIAQRASIEAAQRDGLTAAGVKATQDVERTIVQTAVSVELIDSITARELDRLREDRHLCAHPSIRGLGDSFEPRAEMARAHLALALESVLTLPATQGQKVVERFAAHVADAHFTATADYLVQTFYDRVRPAARRRIIDLAVKHALLELPAPDPPGPAVIADRMAACITAFVQRDRPEVRDAFAKALQRPQLADGSTLLRAFGRVGDLEVLWDHVDEPMSARVDGMVAALAPLDVYGNLSPDQAAVLSLVGSSAARLRLPSLEAKFLSLHPRARASVMARRVEPYFAPFVAGLVREAGGWRSAEEIARNAVVPYGPLLSLAELQEVLTAWAENDQCRTAGDMLSLSIELFQATAHLRPLDVPVWRSFIEAVRVREPATSAYRYTELEGHLPV